jgi:hypothetical protein
MEKVCLLFIPITGVLTPKPRFFLWILHVYLVAQSLGVKLLYLPIRSSKQPQDFCHY